MRGISMWLLFLAYVGAFFAMVYALVLMHCPRPLAIALVAVAIIPFGLAFSWVADRLH